MRLSIPMPTYDTHCVRCDFSGEIDKPREAALPRCPECGSSLKQVYHPPAIVYAASGFTATDTRLEKMIGKKRYARFAAQKSDAEQRARQGHLTEYERALEAV